MQASIYGTFKTLIHNIRREYSRRCSKPLYIIYAESIAAVAKKQLELLSRFDTSVTRAGLMYVWP